MTADARFLGSGWAFPPTFEDGGRDVALAGGTDDIAQSLEILLGTRLGERIMRPDFGSDLHDYQFEEVGRRLVNNLRDLVATAIVRYEARVDLENVAVDQSQALDGVLLITVTYRVRATNSRYNLVYPFYLNDAHG